MRTIRIYLMVALAAAIALLASCKKEEVLYDKIDASAPYTTLSNISNELNGAYNIMGGASSLGSYGLSVGDMAGRIAGANPSTGHLVSINRFTFSTSDRYISGIWQMGYYAYSAATRTIVKATGMVETLPEHEIPLAYMYMAELYAVRAISEYYLANYFALPYSEATKALPSVVLIPEDRVVEIGETVQRASLEQVYASILANCQRSLEWYAKAEAAGKAFQEAGKRNEYYLNPSAVHAIMARAYRDMGDWANAIEEAKRAIEGRVLPPAQDRTIFNSLAANPNEIIFTLKKAEDDNLSANALNTLYGSYLGIIRAGVIEKMKEDKDERLWLGNGKVQAENQPVKWGGIPGAAATSNVPIIRVAEMHLIIAEASIRKGDNATAKQHLEKVAARGGATHAATITKGDFADLEQEYMREFYAEGHDFFLCRRLGAETSVPEKWDLSKFCYPIPDVETNAAAGAKNDADEAPNWDVEGQKLIRRGVK